MEFTLAWTPSRFLELHESWSITTVAICSSSSRAIPSDSSWTCWRAKVAKRVKLFIHFPMMPMSHSTDGTGHNLPESPFASPHHSKSSSNSHIPEEHHDQPPSLSIKEKMMGLDLNEVFNLAPPHNDIICCICLKHCVEPSKLDRSHTFCMQCILKVIKGSKDECPICRQHIDSQQQPVLCDLEMGGESSELGSECLTHLSALAKRKLYSILDPDVWNLIASSEETQYACVHIADLQLHSASMAANAADKYSHLFKPAHWLCIQHYNVRAKNPKYHLGLHRLSVNISTATHVRAWLEKAPPVLDFVRPSDIVPLNQFAGDVSAYTSAIVAIAITGVDQMLNTINIIFIADDPEVENTYKVFVIL
ncbi:hypothetical protein SELMODRAFT_418467 [Selaginella moellendorffii]|uniref:RING-type E3 ubiquitin transferase n=1 Tax=Selaginella moellendorffii TaxID=88036 RepID=D8S5T3_SELML|nr:hypothetical protein SELMODRAFT_418467 [Selaginella moellendorffii]